MKKHTIQIILVTVVLSFAVNSTISFAQKNRAVATSVADILSQLPAGDSIQFNRLMNGLVSLGPDGFAEVVKMLKTPGTGNDVQARYAISGLASYTSRTGLEKEKEFAETNLLNAVAQIHDKEVKAFLIRQLYLVGSNKSLEVLQTYLHDNRLAEPAARAIVAIRAERSEDVLAEALSAVESENRVTIVNALGELDSEKVIQELIVLAESDQANLRKTALAALAGTGSPAAYNILWENARKIGFGYDATNAAAVFIEYAGNLGRNGHSRHCRKSCKAVMKANQTPDKLHNYSAALNIYARYFGQEALPLLLKAVENNDKAFRFSALNLAEKMGGEETTDKWISTAQKARPEVKAEIIRMLGRRGDILAWNTLRESLESSSGEVREASIKAIVQLSGDNAFPVLLNHLLNGRDIETTKEALLSLSSLKDLPIIAEQLDHTQGTTKAALIDIIAARSGNAYFEIILPITASSDEQERAAAFKGLKSISSATDMESLLNLLLSLSDEKEIEEVQAALVEAVSDSEDKEQNSKELLQALETTCKKPRIIRVLPGTGGQKALEAVNAYYNDSRGEIQEAAFNALVEWEDYEASSYLFEICKNREGEYRSKALEGYVSQVQKADLPDEQKLLQYRKVMPYASGTKKKEKIITEIGKLKTFLSLVYIGKYLDDEELQQEAARAVMNIALPNRRGENGFTGEIAKGLLIKAADLFAGAEIEYNVVRINNYLEKMPDETGFVSMFNGENLDGWLGFVGNPYEREKMGKEELAEKQAEANKMMHAKWSVKDGSIVFNGEGYEENNLVYHKKFSDFEMIVDWKILKFGDSGIYLRGSPQVQIWDPALSKEGSGGLFNNMINPRNPLASADNPVGEWNTCRIIMTGEKVTVYLNGILVVDSVTLENYWDRNSPIFPEETIELQSHGNDLYFRDIYIREIIDGYNQLNEEEKTEGFTSLFNGNDLEGWFGDKESYIVEDGIIAVHPQQGLAGNLYTAKEYADFIFRFEFRLTPSANNGVGIHSHIDSSTGYVGTEIQILDNTAPVFASLRPSQYHGSVYNLITAKRGCLKPVGQWNSQEVMVKGYDIKVTLNGEVILEGNMKDALIEASPDNREHPELAYMKGRIAFLGHNSELYFRNIRIKELEE